MIRALRLIAVIAAGMTLGAGGSFAVQHVAAPAEGERPAALGDSGGQEPVIGASGASPASDVTSPLRGDTPGAPQLDAPVPDAPSPPVAPSTRASAEPPVERVLLAWVAGGLPQGFAGDVAAISHVDAVTLVRGELLELVGSRGAEGRPIDQLAEGSVIPLDAIALDPATYAAFLPKSSQPAFDELRSGQALLSRTSAALRRLGPGGIVLLADGTSLTVAGIVDDELVGGAELALTFEGGEEAGLATPRYLLIAYHGERAAVEEAIRSAAPPGALLRLRGPGETPYLRHGDAVLPQAAIKQRFGEFSYRPAPGRDIRQDPQWTAAHIASGDIPILGEVRCHRALLPALEGAMAELVALKLSHTVDPAGFAGCWAPRLTNSEQSVSRHAWGAALDLNWPKNPVGQASAQDRRLVEVMERWGFTWGGNWLIPDPAHFEYVQPATPAR